MFLPPAEYSDRQLRLHRIIAQYWEAVAGGEPLDGAAWIGGHPDFQDELRLFLAQRNRFQMLPPRVIAADPLAATTEALTDPAITVETNAIGSSAGNLPTVAAAPREFGQYELLQELGHGGMGVVYKARQRTPARLVALKMIRSGHLASPVDLRRFAEEAQAVALLDHPAIVPIYEVGQQEGRGFYTMKLMEAGCLSRQLPRFSQAPRAAATLVEKIARAVHHAHCRGILHRDLKPSNILLDSQDEPYVADFGLACRLEAVGELTATGELVGTPPYMAPEQILVGKHNVTVATDVYGLGAVLYTLLTGSPPARGENVLETLRQIQEREPAAPRSANPRVDRNLETICLKALKKKPEHRYASAAELADDLELYLGGHAIRARPAGWLERTLLSMRRHPIVTGLLAAALFLVAATVSGLYAHSVTLGIVNDQLATSLSHSQRASQQAIAAQRRAEQSEAEAGLLLYVSDMALAAQAARDGDLRQLHDLLVRHRPAPEATDHRGFEWHYLWRMGRVDQQKVGSHAGPVYMTCFSPDGRTLATAGKDAKIRLYEAAGYQEELVLDSGQIEVNGLAFSPEGDQLASAGDDGSVILWDLASGQQLLRIAAHSNQAYQVAFVPGRDRLITCGDDAVITLWDRHSGQAVARLQGHQRAVEAISLSPDGRTLASASSDETVRLWDLETQTQRRVYEGHSGRVSSVQFSPQGDCVASASLDKTVQVWNAATGDRMFAGSSVDAFQSLTFSASGLEIAAGDRGGAISLFRAAGAQWDEHAKLVNRWQAHHGRVYNVSFSSPDRSIVSAAQDGLVTVWKRPTAKSPTLLKPGKPVRDMTCIAGRDWVAITQGPAVQVWDVATSQRIMTLPTAGPCDAVAATADGRQLAAVDEGGQLRVWNLSDRTGQLRLSIRHPFGTGCKLAFSPDGKRLAVSALLKDRLWIVDAVSGQIQSQITAVSCYRPAFSPDGRQLAIPAQNDVLLWDLNEQVLLAPLRGHSSTVNAVSYSPDGGSIVTVSNDRLVKVWDPATATEMHSLAGHRAEATAIDFSPDGRSLISGSEDRTLRAWHVASGRPLYQLELVGSQVCGLQFSAGGNYLVGLLEGSEGTLVVLDTGVAAE